MYPEVIEVFIRASDLVEMGERDFSIIQRYVILMYDRTSGIEDVNDCRKYLFTKNGRKIENCPPTKDALMQHVLRSKLVSNTWINCMKSIHPEPAYEKWGWMLDDGNLKPRWTTLPIASCKELISCTCKNDV